MATTKYIVDNVTGQTITGDLTINGNFTITGTTNTRPYKVYTALVTQSGVGNELQLTGGTLTIGVTYWITDDSGNPDWTNVGAPNNMENTYFVATGTNPNSWGNNGASLNYNTGAPIVTVLENTIGNIYFQYNGTGYYSVDTYPDTLFTIGKTTGFIASVGDDPAAASYGFLRPVGNDRFYILTNDIGFNNVNSFLINTPIEIRVYN